MKYKKYEEVKQYENKARSNMSIRINIIAIIALVIAIQILLLNSYRLNIKMLEKEQYIRDLEEILEVLEINREGISI
jgi:hypothetical protein